MLLRPASSSVIAIVGAGETLTSHTIISRETGTYTSFPITGASVRTLRPRMQIISIDHVTDPRVVVRTSTERTVGAGPLRLAVHSRVAEAVLVNHTTAVTRAAILTQSPHSMALLHIPGSLSVALGSERWHTGWCSRIRLDKTGDLEVVTEGGKSRNPLTRWSSCACSNSKSSFWERVGSGCHVDGLLSIVSGSCYNVCNGTIISTVLRNCSQVLDCPGFTSS
mmetsp:Transcript_119692/g.290486  ORF Transcript_119692/g.290486 Transcript_119692/m.290486 type:complete len:223 (+) Transcript_119692:204-872(+)